MDVIQKLLVLKKLPANPTSPYCYLSYLTIVKKQH